MNFLDALRSGKRFRPKGEEGWMPNAWSLQFKLYGKNFTSEDLLGEWEIEQEPCKHEPCGLWGDKLKFDTMCKYCGVELEPTGWRAK